MPGVDYRELIENDEEAFYALVDYIRSITPAMYPVKVKEDTKEGKDVKLQSMLKKSRLTKDGKVETFEMTTFDEVPIRFQRGGGVVQTHPVKKDDVGYWVPFSRDIQNVRKKDGIQDPGSTRLNSFSDGYFTSGFRPDPQHKTVMGKDGVRFSKDTHQLRSDDGKHTRDTNPKAGFTDKSVHKDDKTDKDGSPFKDAKKYAEHKNIGDSGVVTTLMVDKDKKHQHEIDSSYTGHKIGTGNKNGPRNHYVDLHEDDDKAYSMGVCKDSHYHKCNKSAGHKISADKDKQYLELKPGNTATLHSDKEVKLDCPDGKCKSNTPEHEFTKDIKVTDTVNCKDCTATNKVEGNQIKGLTGMFGSLGGGGGGGGGGGAGGSMGIDSDGIGGMSGNPLKLKGPLAGNADGTPLYSPGGFTTNVADVDDTDFGGGISGSWVWGSWLGCDQLHISSPPASGGGIFYDSDSLPGNYANDSAAATGGIPVGGVYRNGSVLMVRVT